MSEILAEQDPWTRARMAGADITALQEIFDGAVSVIWTLHAQRRGAATIADSLGVPVSMLLGAIARTQRTHRVPLRH